MILCMSAGYKIGFLTGSKKRYIKSKFMFEKAKKIRIHLLEITIRYQYDTKVLQTMTIGSNSWVPGHLQAVIFHYQFCEVNK